MATHPDTIPLSAKDKAFVRLGEILTGPVPIGKCWWCFHFDEGYPRCTDTCQVWQAKEGEGGVGMTHASDIPPPPRRRATRRWGDCNALESAP